MRQFRTQGIVLARTDYAEADRIITFLTPDHGKVDAIAKGVRKNKSKLAGGIELFSISDLSLIVGRSEIYTLVSSRLIKHYGNIVKDLDRTALAYEVIKRLNRATEDAAEKAYFDLLSSAFAALDDESVGIALIELWFNMQLLKLTGHTPNLSTDTSGKKLQADKHYSFDFDKMAFWPSNDGSFGVDHIKFLRLGFGPHSAHALNKVSGHKELETSLLPLIKAMLQAHIRL